MVDARIVSEAEMEAGHRLPREYSVVGDIRLVYVAVACEEDWRGAQELSNRKVVELNPDDGRYPRALLSIYIDVRGSAQDRRT